jgi:phage-related protein
METRYDERISLLKEQVEFIIKNEKSDVIRRRKIAELLFEFDAKTNEHLATFELNPNYIIEDRFYEKITSRYLAQKVQQPEFTLVLNLMNP